MIPVYNIYIVKTILCNHKLHILEILACGMKRRLKNGSASLCNFHEKGCEGHLQHLISNGTISFSPLCENEFGAARRPRQTQKYKIRSANSGRAKRSHFSVIPSFCKPKFPKYAIYACKVLFLRCKYCILVSFTAGFACQNTL